MHYTCNLTFGLGSKKDPNKPIKYIGKPLRLHPEASLFECKLSLN